MPLPILQKDLVWFVELIVSVCIRDLIVSAGNRMKLYPTPATKNVSKFLYVRDEISKKTS